jgi:hypothetical protein
MFMPNKLLATEVDVFTLQEQHHDLLRQSENERLARSFQTRTSAQRLYRKATNWLGAALVRLGCFLAAPESVPACRLQPVV